MAEGDKLEYVKRYKDGRVKAVNVWKTGRDVLIYPNIEAFNRAKEAVENRGEVPKVVGYTPIDANA